MYTCSYFLHIPNRFPVLGAIRIDLIIVFLLAVAIFSQLDAVSGKFDNIINKSTTILLLYILISLPFVEWPGSVIRNNYPLFIKAIVFYFFTVSIVDTTPRLRNYILIIVFCQLFRIIEPLYLNMTTGYWGSSTFIGGGEFTDRLSGAPSDVVNPNGLALVIALTLAFIHYLFGKSRLLIRAIYFALVPLMMYALVLTMSRSGVIAVMIIFVNMFIKSNYKILLVIFSVLLAYGLWANMNDYQKDRYLSITGGGSEASNESFDGRRRGMLKDFQVGMHRPIFGHGLGTSREAIYNVRGGGQVSHILYAEVIIELGIIGFIIYMVFLKQIYTTLKNNRSMCNDISSRKNSDVIARTDPSILDSLNYHFKLLDACSSCFWMLLIFSVAQYGLSEFHWYLIAGILSVQNRILNENRNHIITDSRVNG